MTATERAITRIVIACDAVGENVSSIALAAQLAGALNAAMHAIFVQDEGLLDWAALPFARPVSVGGEAAASLDENAILHHFAAHADRVRAALAAAASTHAVGWSFDVVRGRPSLAALSSGEQDLLVIEATSRPFAGGFRLDSRWLVQAFQSERPVLLVRSLGLKKDGIVALVQKAARSADRIIAIAAVLALASDRKLTILLADEAVGAEAALDRVRAVSGKLAARCRIERLSPASFPIGQIAVEGSMLLVDADPAVNDAAALKDLTAQTRADILFLR